MPSRSFVVVKSLLQLGSEPLLLNALYRFGLWTGHYGRAEKSGLESGGPVSIIHSLFSFPLPEDLLRTLGKDGKVELLKEADEIVKGKVRLFDGEPVPLQLTFKAPLLHWTAYETNPKLLSPLYSLVSDVKFLWEPARFGWAFTLGRAYYLTKLSKSRKPPKSDPAEKYAEAFWKYFEKFGDYRQLAVHYIWEDLWWQRKNKPIDWLEKLVRT